MWRQALNFATKLSPCPIYMFIQYVICLLLHIEDKDDRETDLERILIKLHSTTQEIN